MIFYHSHPLRKSRAVPLTIILIVSTIVALSSCRTLPAPILPPEDVPEDPVEAYKAYRLFTAGPNISFHVLQGYGEINPTYDLLEPLFEISSEEARTAFIKSRRRGKSGITLSGIGGALMGVSLGYDLAVDSQGGTPVLIVFSTGAVMAVLGIILAGSSTGPFMDSVEAYNLDLIERWGLDISDVPEP